ncbi:hypothetical protein BKA63DRAFT_161634 [Paraphoma chrysanthemicola]|nr:hypothetical protein BKA63DRAFT_161634 [Paraphoma chrysanthemicola]
MPRLGSKKSRNGCIQCKTRRVKCDENRPCGACTRYHVECSLLSYTAPLRQSTSSPQTHASTASANGSGNGARTPFRGLSASPSTADQDATYSHEKGATIPAELCEQWMRDLELMHHFTAHAYQTMPGLDSTKQIWGYSVPQEAFKFPFLMHSILAFSANHLAHLSPTKAAHYRLLSGTHYTAAVTGLNGALVDIGPSNCHAIFVAASMTVVNAFADARAYDPEVLIETFQLLRGMDYVLQKTTPMIEKGPFAAIIRQATDAPKPSPLLSSLLVDLQASACSPTSDPTPEQALRLQATDVLRKSLQYAIETSPYPAFRASMIWPISIEADFIELLKVRTDSEVVELFKHYCQLLDVAASEFWFMTNWKNLWRQL